MSVEVNDIDFTALKQLSQKSDELKAVERELLDFVSCEKYLKAIKDRQQTEEEIFKLIKEL